MGRELRHVPADWAHPTDGKGHFIPQFEQPYRLAAAAYAEALALWESGNDIDRARAERAGCRSYAEWAGDPPDPDSYRSREWTEAEATHIQLYETTTEGTPISPIFDNLDDLCAWAAEHATTFGRATATADEWRAMLSPGNYVHHQEGNLIFL